MIPLPVSALPYMEIPHDGYCSSAYNLTRPGMFPSSHTHKKFQEDRIIQTLQRREESEAKKGHNEGSHVAMWHTGGQWPL